MTPRSAGCWSAPCATAGMRPATFDAAEPALTALRREAPDVLITDIRMSGPVRAGAAAQHPRHPPHPAGDRHDGVLGPRQRRVGLRGRRVRVPAEAVRHRSGRGPGAARRAAAAGQGDGRQLRRPRIPELLGTRPGDAAGVSRHRAPVALQRHRADHRRVRHRQGAGRARAARSQSARRQAVHRAQHLGHSRGPARVGAVRPRERLLHRRRQPSGAAASSRPTAARCSSTRSATCRLLCRRACCVCWRKGSSIGSAARPHPRGRARHRRDPPEPAGPCAARSRSARISTIA